MATRPCGVGIAIIAFLGVSFVGSPADANATAAAVGAPGRSVTAAASASCISAPFVAAFDDGWGSVEAVDNTGTSYSYGYVNGNYGSGCAAGLHADRTAHPNLDARIVAAAPAIPMDAVVVDRFGHVAPVERTGSPSPWHGDITFPLRRPIVSIATGGSRYGYWLAASDGGVFRFGRFRFYGSMGGRPLNSPIVAIISAPVADGYWLVAADGGVFSFGSARFHGSTGNLHLARPIVGAARTVSGNGYWLVAADGGVFSFGDARFLGSAAPLHLAQPVVSIATTQTGNGYWITTADHNILNYGDAAPIAAR